MKNYIYKLQFTIFIFCFLSLHAYAQNTKLAQTGMKFLSVSNNARSAGMSDANTTLNLASASMFYNPSAMAEMKNLVDFSFGTTRWIANINYYEASIALSPFEGEFGVIKGGFERYRCIKETIVILNHSLTGHVASK